MRCQGHRQSLAIKHRQGSMKPVSTYQNSVGLASKGCFKLQSSGVAAIDCRGGSRLLMAVGSRLAPWSAKLLWGMWSKWHCPGLRAWTDSESNASIAAEPQSIRRRLYSSQSFQFINCWCMTFRTTTQDMHKHFMKGRNDPGFKPPHKYARQWGSSSHLICWLEILHLMPSTDAAKGPGTRVWAVHGFCASAADTSAGYSPTNYRRWSWIQKGRRSSATPTPQEPFRQGSTGSKPIPRGSICVFFSICFIIIAPKRHPKTIRTWRGVAGVSQLWIGLGPHHLPRSVRATQTRRCPS